jgi:gas vesicle protein
MMAGDKQDDAGITEANIAESIDELENLIEDTDTPPKLHDEIPVLNDVVDPAEATGDEQGESATATTDKIEDIPLERLSELVDTVDRKLSSELDSFVDLLKDTIKTSIIDELKEELKKGATQMKSAPSETDTPDDPSE